VPFVLTANVIFTVCPALALIVSTEAPVSFADVVTFIGLGAAEAGLVLVEVFGVVVIAAGAGVVVEDFAGVVELVGATFAALLATGDMGDL
jgi:hypothetical protein